MLRVRLITDPFNLAEYSEHEAVALIPFLAEQFPTWPETARLYRDGIATELDVTPQSEEDIAALNAVDNGLFYVVVYPADPVTAIIITAVAVLALTVAVLLFLTPKIPRPGDTSESANNSLGNRVNKPRPNGRVPDIFGQVIAVPELLAVPLVFFEDNLEREICYMCVGRGAYEIEAVKDGDTPIEQIAGAAAKFYGPDTSPNSGVPFLEVGGDIDMPLMDVIRLNDVNGQILRAPNANQVSGDGDIRFVYPDTIQRTGTEIDFTDYFAPGDQLIVSGSSFTDDPGLTELSQSSRFTLTGKIQFETFNPTTAFAIGQYITVTNAGFADATGGGGVQYVDLSGTYLISGVSATEVTLSAPDAVNPDWLLLDNYVADRTTYRTSTFSVPGETTGFNLDGTYNVVSVAAGSIVLTNPGLVNAAWNNLDDLDGGATDYLSPSLSTSGERWVGPFIVDQLTCEQVVCNIVALQGMYLVTKKGKNRPRSVTVEVEIAPVDEDGVPNGPAETFNITVSGDGKDKNPRGVTLFASMTFHGRCSIRARRTTDLDLDSEDTIVDEVKWRDAFGTAPVAPLHFGDVTTIHTLTLATSGATAVKERKLNCRATRRILERNLDDTFGPALIASANAANIICHMALDPFIGGRTLAELDVPQLFDTVAEVATYFGAPETGTFNYTFDQDNISFEEMAQTVAQAVFCTAYRQGSVFRLFFERATEDSILLFNHRNKTPGSETRTVRFGYLNDHDGVEMDYVSPRDGTKLTLYMPADQSAAKPKKLEVIGVQSEPHAFLHAARAYNKIRYQHTTTQFTALSEASQLVLSQRIEVADNTRPDIFDGHVVAVDGLVLELSQPFAAVEDVEYTMFLQMPSGQVERIAVVSGDDASHVVLQAPPSEALVIDPDAWADIVYQIVGSDNARPTAFLLTEKGAYDKKTVGVQAINYDPRYYADDQTYSDALLTEDGDFLVTEDGQRINTEG